MYKPFDLTGKVALVTGGNSGIGLGMARALAQAGADVAIWGTNANKNAAAKAELADERAQGAGPRVRRLATRQAVEAAFAETVDALGRVDGCFANAGVSGRGGALVPGDEQRGMAPRAEGQSRRRLLHLPRRRAPHGRARRRRRAGRHGLAGGHRGRAAQRALRRHQGRPDLDDPRAGGRVRAPRRARQRHPAGLDRDRHDGQRHRQREVRQATCCRASPCAAGAPATTSAASPST